MRTETLHSVNSVEGIRLLPSDVLRLKGNDLGDPEVLAIARLGSLKELSISGCDKVTDRSVAELGQLSSLEDLDLSFCNQITSTSLAALAKLPELRSITLNWCYGITDSGLIALGRCRSLQSISLWSCEEITDAAVEALGSLPNLKNLELPEFAVITDRALLALSAKAKKLESLRLDHLADISDQGVTRLKALEHLRSLTINGCAKITEKSVAVLQRTLPQLQINFHIRN